MDYMDLRSDTVTKPSPAMREAMAKAEVGDDVWGDDPTVNLLQEKVATMFRKEAALFVPSGTMANIVSILAHTRRGDEVIVEKESHTFNYECAGAATLAGVQLYPVTGTNGILTLEQVRSATRPVEDVHVPKTKLLCLENTHNRGGGKIYPIDILAQIYNFTQSHSIKSHLDGARLFNACVATGREPWNYAQYFDSLMFCFSKGLGAPVGSIVIGTKEFIHQAHGYRKMLGGGMRQVGILAAAAHFALENNVERLKNDHQHAQLIAQAVAQIKKFHIDPENVETNIVIFDVAKSGLNAYQVVELLQKKGVLMVPFGEYLVRAVTHLDVNREQIELAIKIIRETFV
jgi:threonine aldolase